MTIDEHYDLMGRIFKLLKELGIPIPRVTKEEIYSDKFAMYLTSNVYEVIIDIFKSVQDNKSDLTHEKFIEYMREFKSPKISNPILKQLYQISMQKEDYELSKILNDIINS